MAFNRFDPRFFFAYFFFFFASFFRFFASPLFATFLFALFFLGLPLFGSFSLLAPFGLATLARFGSFAGTALFLAFFGDPGLACFPLGIGIGVRPTARTGDQSKAEHRDNRQNPHRSLQRLSTFANVSIWICEGRRASRR